MTLHHPSEFSHPEAHIRLMVSGPDERERRLEVQAHFVALAVGECRDDRRVRAQRERDVRGRQQHLVTEKLDPFTCVGDGSVGELYDCANDPLQRRNLWHEPSWQARKRDLIADLYANLPPERTPKLDAVANV